MSNQIVTRKQNAAFPIVAIIRKGDKKQPNRPGKDLEDKFRVVFEPGFEEYQERFVKEYGDIYPKQINGMLPFNDLQACYEVSSEAYQAGMMVFKAVNGQVIVHRDPSNKGEYLVRDGVAQVEGAKLTYDPYEMPAITYTGHDGSAKSLPIKTQTRFRLFIPEMKDMVWFLLKSNSYYDSLNIQQNLEAVQAVADAATGGNVAGVRIIVFRAQQDILWNSSSGPKRIKKWLIQIKIDPEWVERMMVRMSTNTLNAGTQVQGQLQAPDNAPDPDLDQDTSDDNIIEGEIVSHDPEPKIEDKKQEDDPAQAVADAAVEVKRPYPPEILRIRIKERAEAHANDAASPKQRKLVVALLSEYFAGDDDKRHTVQEYLYGASSLNEATDAQILATLDWMTPTQDPETNNYYMSEDARIELSQVHDIALKVQGQTALF